MNIKTCSMCKKELPASDHHFYRQESGKYGLRSRCKECYKSEIRRVRHEDPEKYNKYMRDYVEKNKERITSYKRDYMRTYMKGYREKNREKINSYMRAYRDTHDSYRERGRELARKYYYKKKEEKGNV